jgi:putative peptidoglycan lipid II flippase
MLGGVVVAAVFTAVAYLLDRPDMRPLAARLVTRLGRRRPVTPSASARRAPGDAGPAHAEPDGKEQP